MNRYLRIDYCIVSSCKHVCLYILKYHMEPDLTLFVTTTHVKSYCNLIYIFIYLAFLFVYLFQSSDLGTSSKLFIRICKQIQHQNHKSLKCSAYGNKQPLRISLKSHTHLNLIECYIVKIVFSLL